MTLYYFAQLGTLLHELHHTMSYSFTPTVNQYASFWYVETSANWFAYQTSGSLYRKLDNGGVIWALPYLNLWHSLNDQVLLFS